MDETRMIEARLIEKMPRIRTWPNMMEEAWKRERERLASDDIVDLPLDSNIHAIYLMRTVHTHQVRFIHAFDGVMDAPHRYRINRKYIMNTFLTLTLIYFRHPASSSFHPSRCDRSNHRITLSKGI
jgi:hypothetical protein